MRTRLTPALVVTMLAVMTAAGCSGGETTNDDQAIARAELRQRSEQIGDELLARFHGRVASNQDAPESRAASLTGDSPDHGPWHWTWSARVRLRDYTDRTPAQETKALADHLVAQGWQQGTAPRGDPGATVMYKIDADGAWEVDLLAPAQHTVDIVVISPVTADG